MFIEEYVKRLLRKHIAFKLHNKKFIWTTHVRVFTDGGYPIVRIIPRFHCIGYAPYWHIRGFYCSWAGREFYFSFKKDINGLYKDIKVCVD